MPYACEAIAEAVEEASAALRAENERLLKAAKKAIGFFNPHRHDIGPAGTLALAELEHEIRQCEGADDGE